jgi:hypothetical protein
MQKDETGKIGVLGHDSEAACNGIFPDVDILQGGVDINHELAITARPNARIAGVSSRRSDIAPSGDFFDAVATSHEFAREAKAGCYIFWLKHRELQENFFLAFARAKIFEHGLNRNPETSDGLLPVAEGKIYGDAICRKIVLAVNIARSLAA